MADVLVKVVVSALLLVECLLGETIERRKRDTEIVNDIALDFLKIFHDIKQIRSTIPNHVFTNLTFDSDKAHALLHENLNNKRTTITNPRTELRDSIDKKLLSSPLATDVLMTDSMTDFQTRHNDPLHKRHGVGEGLATLPDNEKKSDVTVAPDELNHSIRGASNVSSEQNKTSESIKNVTSTTGNIENRNETKLNGSTTDISKSNSSEHKAAATSDIMKTLGELKGLESQINHLMENSSSNGTTNGTMTHDLSERNMIFESKIKGFLAKLDTFKFSDVGYEEPNYYYKLQKYANQTGNISTVDNSNVKKSAPSNDSSAGNTSSGSPISTEKGDKDGDKKVKVALSSSKDSPMNSSTPVSGVGGTKKTEESVISITPSNHASLVNTPHEIQLRRLPVKTDVNRKKDTIDAAFEPECSDTKKCPANKYCRHFECFDCHHKHHECVAHEQCCDGMPCIYGRCDVKGKSSPGTICKNDADCLNGCCVLEPTINLESGICKIKLAEYHQCSPVLYRKVWIGDKKPTCGPCQDHLECTNKGVVATHLVCMKKGSK